MPLIVESEKARELAEELARLTGEEVGEAVTEALERRVEEKRRERELVRRAMDIVDKAQVGPANLTPLELYDERGLPA